MDAQDESTADLQITVDNLNASVDQLVTAIETLGQRTNVTRKAIVAIGVLFAFAIAGVIWAFLYTRHIEDQEREDLLAEQAIIEETFRSGCENSVTTRDNSRNELLEFGRYLGSRGGLPAEEIDAEITALIERFNAINPPRDCAAEAAAREAARRGN